MPDKSADGANGIPHDSPKLRTPRKSRAKDFSEPLDRLLAEVRRVPPADNDEHLVERAAGVTQLGPFRPEVQREAQAMLWERFGASQATLAAWGSRRFMRAREALALYQGLDPDAVFRGPNPMDRLSRLVLCFRAVPGEPLREFETQLFRLICSSKSLAADGSWVVSPVEAWSCFTEEHFPRIDFHQAPRISKRPRHRTPLLDLVEAAWALYDDESYSPGDRASEPKVKEYLRAKAPWMAKSMCDAIGQIVRPVDMPKGRPPTRPFNQRRKVK